MPSPAFENLRTAIILNRPLEQLIQNFKSGVKLDEFDDKGISIYHSAIRRGRYDFIQYLFENENLDINQRTKQGLTPIQYIIREKLSDSYGKIRFFVERGADLEAPHQNNATALHYACMAGEEAAVRELLDNGAHINAIMGIIQQGDLKVGGWMPLHIAAQQGFTSIVNLLISRGANKDAMDYTGFTPLQIACRQGANGAEAAIALANNGANVNRRYHQNGDTPLHEAAKNNQLGVVKALLANGADPNASNLSGATPFAAISRSPEHAEVVRALISTGAEARTETLAEKATREKQEIVFEGYKKRLEILRNAQENNVDSSLQEAAARQQLPQTPPPKKHSNGSEGHSSEHSSSSSSSPAGSVGSSPSDFPPRNSNKASSATTAATAAASDDCPDAQLYRAFDNSSKSEKDLIRMFDAGVTLRWRDPEDGDSVFHKALVCRRLDLASHILKKMPTVDGKKTVDLENAKDGSNLIFSLLRGINAECYGGDNNPENFIPVIQLCIDNGINLNARCRNEPTGKTVFEYIKLLEENMEPIATFLRKAINQQSMPASKAPHSTMYRPPNNLALPLPTQSAGVRKDERKEHGCVMM